MGLLKDSHNVAEEAKVRALAAEMKVANVEAAKVAKSKL